MNYVVNSYENYKEENRLTTNNARRIEFITTTRVFDKWNETQFKIWCDYHYSVCRELSVLGASNHVVIIGRK